MNWVGVDDPEVAAKLFSTAGIPSKAVVSGGKISAIQLEHTWVEAYLGYERYRGTEEDSGSKMWIPLDPSFKQYKYKEPIDLKSTIGLNPSLFLTTNTAILEARLDEATKALSNYIANDLPEAKLKDITGEKRIIKEELGLLPSSLPRAIKPLSITKEQSSLDDNQRYILSLKTDGLNYTSSLVELAGKRITIYYSAATKEDASLISRYTSLEAAPSYLVKLKPVVLVDGKAKEAGSPITLGKDQILEVKLSNPAYTSKATKVLTSGAYYSIGLDKGAISTKEIALRKEKLSKAINAARGGEETDIDKLTGELLNLTSLLYFGEVDSLTSKLANLTKVVAYKQTAVAIPSYPLDATYLFGVPIKVNFTAPNFDLIINPYIVKAKDGDLSKEKNFTTTSGYLASGAEGAIFEQLYRTKAVSTVKLFALASKQNIPFHQITSSNIDTKLPLIQATKEVKEAIQNSINQGRVVTILDRPITYYNWTGTAWIDTDPLTGEAGYFISGKIAGGSVVETGKEIMAALKPISMFLGLNIERVDFINKAGNPDFRYRYSSSKQFINTDIGQALEVISLIVKPLVDAIFQYLKDMNNPKLTDTQKLQRAGAVFVVMATVALAGSMLGPAWGMAFSIIVGSFIWPMISETVLDYYFGASAKLLFGKADYCYA
jgi:hypothetical protein